MSDVSVYPREEHKGIALTGNGLEQANSLHMILICFFLKEVGRRQGGTEVRWNNTNCTHLCKISLAVQKLPYLILTVSAIKIFLCIGSLIFMCKMVSWVFSLLFVAEQEVCWYCNCIISHIITYKIQKSRISIHSLHKTSSVWK